MKKKFFPGKRFSYLGCLFLLGFLLLAATQALASYPAPQFKDAMVFSFWNDDGTKGTSFFARISGPSPEDIVSLSVTGPSGTFYPMPQATFRQWGLFYFYTQGVVVENGAYTFSVTDSEGRTVTTTKNFTYNDAVPQVDAAGMSPAMGAYVGTTTPTLSFSPVAGTYKYQVLVSDMDMTAFWYNATNLSIHSITIPSGYLQPNTAYRWVVRAWDPERQNFHESKPFYFYTGTKTDPEISRSGVLSLPWGTVTGNYLYGFGANTAPWDMASFTATGPESAVYNLAATRQYSFQMGGWNYAFAILDPPVSVPDGTYTFDLTNKEGKSASTSVAFTADPIPDFESESRLPENNVYMDTDRPTFSWSRVAGDPGDGTYLYSVRIMDYMTYVRWYESPKSTVTSFTLPHGLNLPKGTSYKWQVTVTDAAGNNFRASTYRTFTINGPVYPVPNIKANASDGPIILSASAPLCVAIELDPGEYVGQNGDWWITAYTHLDPPYGWVSYVYPGEWKLGIESYAQLPLRNVFPPMDIFYGTLPLGKYTFFFAVDSPDGSPVGPWLIMDSVDVEIQ